WAVAGCDVVFHVAGLVPDWKTPRRTMMAQGLTAIRNTLAILREVTLSRMVVVSSMVALTADGQGGVKPRLPGTLGDDLVQLRYFTELEVLKYAALGYPAVLVHPALCLGAGLRSQALVRAWTRGGVRPTCPGMALVIDGDDAARGIVESAESGRVGKRNLIPGHTVSLQKLADRLGTMAGRPGATLPMPRGAWRIWARRRLPRQVALLCQHGCPLHGAGPRLTQMGSTGSNLITVGPSPKEIRSLDDTLHACLGGVG
ncbi:MAG: hypothetical protein AAFX99_27830, partial [Myxococcota bacterium]